MKHFIVLLCALAVLHQLKGQTAADYDFLQSAVTYPTVPGTIVNSGIAAGSDEMLSASIPIGFNFIYCGITYTNIKISSNGFINPGGAITQPAFNNDLAGATKPVIAPLWDDHALGTAGSVVYSTSGTSPNQVFTVEFRNIKWTYTATTENRSFQVRLYETSNIIEYYYNIVDIPMNSPAASIGFSDITGGSGHFLSITPGASATVSSNVANNSISNATFLNGKMYQFTPSPCPSPTSFAASNFTNSGAQISWLSSSVTDIKYNAGPFNPLTGGILIASATSPYQFSGLNPNTTYYVYLLNHCGMNQSAWAGPFTFSTACNPVTVFPIQEGFNTMVPPTCWSETIVTTSSTPPDWYFATSGFNPINAPYEGNGMAAFNSYNCTNGAQSRLESPYYDFTGITSPILTYQMYHDNTFASSTTEGIQIQATTNGTTWTNLGSFNVRYRTTNGWDDVTLDLSAYTGQTVKVGFLGVSQFGNNMYIDDVYIGNIPTCFPPSIIEISNITATSATAAWVSANGNNAWNYELGLSGFTPGTGTSVFSGNTTDTTHIFNALSNSLTYAFYIQADCGANGLSTWEGPYTFTTLCLPVTTLPLAENFDHSGNLPACWTANHNAASGTYVNWEMVLNDPNGAPSGYGGSGYFASLDCFNGMVDGNSYNLTTVPIFIPGPFYKLSYYAWISSGYSLATPITVRVSSDNGNTWTALYSHDMSIVDTWTQNTILLSAYSQQNILIRFEGYSDWGFGANNLGIDQVEIYADKFIEYSSFGFQESTANDGTIQDTIVLQLSGETFAVTGTLTEGTHYTTTNIPSGLHAQIEVISADSARFTLTGTALNHDNAFDINNIGLEFINVAFTGNSASTITFYKVDTIAINFIDFLVINEVDADQAGSDVREFIELYDGGTGNYSLDGYCIVLYNGNTDVVYNAWGLSGHSTNANGYFVMGTTAVASATLNFPGNTIQNGEDAIALYEGSVASFPAGTAIHKNGLIDAVIYDNGQADNPALLYLVEPGEPQIDENEYGMGTVYSFQRIPNGSGGMQHSFTFAVAPPTPGSENTPAPMLSWSTDTFRESLTNDGSIENFITLTLHNDLVVPTGILQQTIHYTSLNVPAGLNFQLTAINDTTIKVQLTGQAINHLPIDDVANIELHFTNAVFDTHTSTMIVYANRSDLKINFDDPVETQINSSTNFQFYPNPANESLTIILPYKTSGETLRILDISGREIMNQQITDSKTQINTGSLAPGVYILKIRSGQGVFIKSEN